MLMVYRLQVNDLPCKNWKWFYLCCCTTSSSPFRHIIPWRRRYPHFSWFSSHWTQGCNSLSHREFI